MSVTSYTILSLRELLAICHQKINEDWQDPITHVLLIHFTIHIRTGFITRKKKKKEISSGKLSSLSHSETSIHTFQDGGPDHLHLNGL